MHDQVINTVKDKKKKQKFSQTKKELLAIISSYWGENNMEVNHLYGFC